MSSSDTLVSVVLPTHNRPLLLGRALDSVLDQTYTDFEVIVVDDGTQERAEEEVRKRNDSRVRYIQHETSRGGGAARNTGIKAAHGSLLAFLDDDDTWLPHKLAAQVGVLLRQAPEVGFCYGAVIQVMDTGERTTEVAEGVQDLHKIVLARFKGFLTSTLLVRREVFEKVGMFDESFPSHQEAELMVRVGQEYKGYGMRDPLIRMSMETTHEHIGSSIGRRIKGRELLLEKHHFLLAQYPDILAKQYYWLGLLYRDLGDLPKAKKLFTSSWKTRFGMRSFLYSLWYALQ